MYKIEAESIPTWLKHSADISIPGAIDTVCPQSSCSRRVTFTIPDWTPFATTTFVAAARCPACRSVARFFITSFGKTADLELYMHPSPRVRRDSITDRLPGNIPNALKRSYLSVINSFNAGEWDATAVMVRKCLEGITASLLPPEKLSQPLAGQLAELPKSVDLQRPILNMADALRKGGNLGAHFDLEREMTEEIAVQMVEFLDAALEYLFVLPASTQALHDSLLRKNSKKAGKKSQKVSRPTSSN